VRDAVPSLGVETAFADGFEGVCEEDCGLLGFGFCGGLQGRFDEFFEQYEGTLLKPAECLWGEGVGEGFGGNEWRDGGSFCIGFVEVDAVGFSCDFRFQRNDTFE
jgi:hypothetical protein